MTKTHFKVHNIYIFLNLEYSLCVEECSIKCFVMYIVCQVLSLHRSSCYDDGAKLIT